MTLSLFSAIHPFIHFFETCIFLALLGTVSARIGWVMLQ